MNKFMFLHFCFLLKFMSLLLVKASNRKLQFKICVLFSCYCFGGFFGFFFMLLWCTWTFGSILFSV